MLQLNIIYYVDLLLFGKGIKIMIQDIFFTAFNI